MLLSETRAPLTIRPPSIAMCRTLVGSAASERDRRGAIPVRRGGLASVAGEPVRWDRFVLQRNENTRKHLPGFTGATAVLEWVHCGSWSRNEAKDALQQLEKTTHITRDHTHRHLHEVSKTGF